MPSPNEEDREELLDIPVRGQLDTAMPITDRPRGTLVEAKDFSPRYWGPRRGHQAFTRVWESPGTASLYDAITLNGTNDVCAVSTSYEDAFCDLGTTFTLDLWFRLEDLAYAAAVNRIGLYGWTVGVSGAGIDVAIYGGAHTDHERIQATIRTTPTRSSVASIVTLVSGTRISAGTTQAEKYHLRIARNGITAKMWLSGSLEDTETTLSATDPIFRNFGEGTLLWIGRTGAAIATNIAFKGHIYGAVLRDGYFATEPIEAVMPAAPRARNVHHYVLGRNYAMGGLKDHYYDAGRFGVHPRLVFVAGSDYSVTSAVDNAAPAPSPVQGEGTWTTRGSKTVSSAIVGGQLSSAYIS